MAIMMMTIIVMIITGISINQYNIHHTKENHDNNKYNYHLNNFTREKN